MAVRLRLTRCGTKSRPYYRICAMDSATKRDGKSLEILGHYHPLEGEETKRLVVDLERIDHWIRHGAAPTESVASLIKQARKRS